MKILYIFVKYITHINHTHCKWSVGCKCNQIVEDITYFVTECLLEAWFSEKYFKFLISKILLNIPTSTVTFYIVQSLIWIYEVIFIVRKNFRHHFYNKKIF